MSELSILVSTCQGFPLRFSYTPAWDSISASLLLRPSRSDRKPRITSGPTLVFVAGDRAQRIRLQEPEEEGDGWVVWLASTAFDIDQPTHARLKTWIADTFAANGSAPQ